MIRPSSEIVRDTIFSFCFLDDRTLMRFWKESLGDWFSFSFVFVKYDRRDCASDSANLENFVFEDVAEGENAVHFQHADDVVFACDFVDVRDFGEFYEALGDVIKFFGFYEQV